MEYRDYYQTLGVARTATAEEIKKAYRRLARKYHPDVSKEANAEAQFKQVQEAYAVLSEPEKRSAYDQLGSEWKTGEQFRQPPDWGSGYEFRGPPPGAGSGRRANSRRGARAGRGAQPDGDYSDFFSSLFGGASPFGAAQESAARGGRDHHARIDIDLEEAFSGGTRTLELSQPEVGGNGSVALRPHVVRVSIPAGVSDGQSLRLAGKGEPASGEAAAGDLYLEVHIRPHRLYLLDGRNVTLTLPIAPWEAALGAAIPVPTLGGSVEMRVPAGAQSGQKLRLRGRGLPGKQPGDQFVQLKIVLPPADTDEARALYEKMRSELPFDPRAELGR